MSCHSEEIGQAFFDAGVKHVICVQKHRKIEDDAAVFFTKKFYENIFVHGFSTCKAF